MTSPAKKKKLCWNCEGNVSFQEENCPYCGVYLSPSDENTLDEEVEDLFAPPYRTEGEEEESEDHVPASPYGIYEEEEEEQQPVNYEFSSADVKEAIKASSDEVKRVIMPLSLLLSGTVFFLFGLALFLFSRKGVFILQWNGCYWYLYLAFGLIALMVGWRALSQLEETE